MKISSEFNRFIHGVVLADLHKKKWLNFEYPEPCRLPTGVLEFDTFKQLLKDLDPNYPRDEKQRPISYTKFTSKQACEHIEFCIKVAGLSGYEMAFIREEWERIMEGYKQ